MPPPDSALIDAFLASSLRDGSAPWPAGWTSPATVLHVVERAIYHGVAGLLVAQGKDFPDWPEPAQSPLRQHAIAQAMWELRHQMALTSLLEAIHREGILALLLKGTAIAYDLYDDPASRARGDSDLLVSPADVDATRKVLTELGFRRSETAEADHDMQLQESWTKTFEDGSSHAIDLHWQALNTPVLREVLGWEQCAQSATPLPRLAPHAFRLGHAAMLLHACVHSAIHATAPYFVDGEAHYGGDRLIWDYDVHLLVRAFTDEEWETFRALVEQAGLAPVCLAILSRSQAQFGSQIPDRVVERLKAMKPSPAASYLQGRQFTRALRDLQAMNGFTQKVSYVRARLFPPADVLRSKYPRMAGLPVAFLHGRRLVDLFRKRAP